MSEWIESTLGERINLKRGYDLPNNDRIIGDVPIFSSSGLSGFHNQPMSNAPGVITGRYGTIGEVFFSNEPFWPLNTTLYIQDFKGNEPKFVFYYLKQLDWEKYSDKSAVPGVNRNDVHKEIIKFPASLEEQKAIATILSSLDDKIDLLHRQNKTLEAMAETLFRQWFVEEAVAPSENKVCLEELVESISKTHALDSDTVYFLNTSDIYKGEVLPVERSAVAGLPGQAKKSIARNDILFSEIRPANGRFAFVGFEPKDYVVSTKLMVLRSKGIVGESFIYFYLTNSGTLEWLQLVAESRSGTFPQVTFDQISELVVNFQSDEIMRFSTEWCNSALDKMVSNFKQIRILENLRDTLLPKLMSGEIRVAL